MAFIELIESAGHGAPANQLRASLRASAGGVFRLGRAPRRDQEHDGRAAVRARHAGGSTRLALQLLRCSHTAGCCSSVTSPPMTSSPSRRSPPPRRSRRVEAAAVRLAGMVVADATTVSAEDVGRAVESSVSPTPRSSTSSRRRPLRCFFSKTLDALGVQPDAEYAELQPELRDALVTGRPIAVAR